MWFCVFRRPWQSTDLGELLSLTEGLAKRTAANKEVRLDIRLPKHPVTVHTSPFYLMNLIWLCLDELMQFPGKDKSVALGCEKASEGAVMWMRADWAEGDVGEVEKSKTIEDVAQRLNARMHTDREQNTIRVLLSKDKTAADPTV